MKKAYKNIGWIILIVLGIVSAIYCYDHIALPIHIGAVLFMLISLVIASVYYDTISIEEEKEEE